MNPFQHAVPAARAPREGTLPTDAELATINERIALTPQARDDLFVWDFVISNTEVDSHGTWMDESSLRNYASQANGGRGLPYLRHHDTDADERGRVFAGTLSSVTPAEAPVASVQTARAAFRGHGPALTLTETAFMVRGLNLGGTSNDDLIRNIEAGVSASNSIGFSVYVPTAPGSFLECDICERDMFARGPDGKYVCPHQPGVDYEVERGEDKRKYHVIATARIVNATQREASGVYLGSTPGTYTLAARAHEAYQLGQATDRDARLVEDVLHLQRGMVTLGRPAVTFSIPEPVTVVTGAGTAIPDTGTRRADPPAEVAGGDMENSEVVARVRELLADEPDRLARLDLSDVTVESDPVGVLYRMLEAELAEAIAARVAADEARQEFARVVRERLTLDDGEDIAAGIDRVMAEVEIGRQFKGDLVDELMRQMVRAGLEFDEAEQRQLADQLSIAHIKANTNMYREAANKLFPPGRVTEPTVDTKGAPAANPATVRG